MSTPASSASTPEALPEKPGGRHTGLIIGVIIVALAIIAGITVAVAKNKEENSAAGKTTVKIGTTEAADDYWNVIKEKAAAEGINIQVVSFNDYTQPNVALSQGQVDLNAFQHLLFLADYNVKNHDNITPLSATYIVPLNVYSKKYQQLSQLPAGATIAIPNDATNQGRALLVLQKAGLVKLRGSGSALSTPADVIANQSKVKIKAIDAAQTAASLDGVDGAVVNNNFAADAGLDRNKAIYTDDATGKTADPYLNIIAVKDADKNDPTYQKVAKLWSDPDVEKAIIKQSGGTAKIASGRSKADLDKILSDLTTSIKKSNS
ncbi:methionine ABC transporter substrate-binding protein [Propionibacterium sp. NM47_B9-13]|jgi:D-methionine transport system substrate-binding protein|uniref:ABC-type transporter, periplasmic component n=2 Tax=Cutibacterium modestum TaxID=2559073 RepID=A0AAD1KR53_9ACTN|nr:MetQ/NlpA family ABC transporter substrate-binding protein [Cutibacterium modestum]TGY29844.1 methionine ABC transporter substrate-binding protein [Propionibacterium sp. NM47_B9-13]AOH46128.1 methionine ABC transporter substrate-binding protein [Cutibacterium modestum]EFS73640.1 NLPA lipoprotein [Cutibacterium modestum HL037PA2]EFS91060.1 NLPA lipoprotein [Cutibacterium modestum HL044PA1]EFT14761.1 NLPA lipoprotein [Cutibacterium modestum HL037PA3]